MYKYILGFCQLPAALKAQQKVALLPRKVLSCLNLAWSRSLYRWAAFVSRLPSPIPSPPTIRPSDLPSYPLSPCWPHHFANKVTFCLFNISLISRAKPAQQQVMLCPPSMSCPMLYAPCLMPHASCPLPRAPCHFFPVSRLVTVSLCQFWPIPERI